MPGGRVASLPHGKCAIAVTVEANPLPQLKVSEKGATLGGATCLIDRRQRCNPPARACAQLIHKDSKGTAFRACVRTRGRKISSCHRSWVPHISLVFREMWDTTAADLHSLRVQIMPIEVRGIPHLAKNERDMGHPRSVVGTKLGPASSMGRPFPWTLQLAAWE